MTWSQKLAFGTFLGTFFVTSVVGQTVVDDSGQLISKQEFETIVRGLRTSLADPISSQIIELRKSDPATVCGKVNFKNGLGGYVGFREFVLSDGVLTVAPNDIPTAEIDVYLKLPSAQQKLMIDRLEKSISTLQQIQKHCEKQK